MIEVPLENAGIVIAAVVVVVLIGAVALYAWWRGKTRDA